MTVRMSDLTVRDVLGVQDLGATARRFHERQLEDRADRIAALIHEDAEMTLLANYLRTTRGRRAIMAALARGREAEIYQAEVEQCELLSDDILLVRGQARYALDDSGVGVSRVWWLDEFRDGLLWRVEAFRTEQAALDAYTSHFSAAV
jgi:SnoaL-like protein